MGSWRAGRIQRNVGEQAERLLFHFGRDCGSCRDLLFYWKRHEMEGPTDLGEWSLSLDSILTWLIV